MGRSGVEGVEGKNMDQLLNRLEKKLTDRDFFNCVKEWLTYSEQQAEKNKRKYFSDNQKLLQAGAVSTGAGKAKEAAKKLLPVEGISAITAIAAYCLTIFPSADAMKWGITALLAVLWLTALVAGGYSHLGAKKLKLRRYGQTWVRHRVTAEKYRQEIIFFLHDLDCYGQAVSSREKERLFMERIMSVYADNINRFADNMKSLEEYIE